MGNYISMAIEKILCIKAIEGGEEDHKGEKHPTSQTWLLNYYLPQKCSL